MLNNYLKYFIAYTILKILSIDMYSDMAYE